jgi:hypothetical protein
MLNFLRGNFAIDNFEKAVLVFCATENESFQNAPIKLGLPQEAGGK